MEYREQVDAWVGSGRNERKVTYEAVVDSSEFAQEVPDFLGVDVKFFRDGVEVPSVQLEKVEFDGNHDLNSVIEMVAENAFDYFQKEWAMDRGEDAGMDRDYRRYGR